MVACSRAPQPEDLRTYLERVATMTPDDRTREVAGWKLDEAAWRDTVVEPYRGIYADYAVGFDAAVPTLATRLSAGRGAIATRAHFADDPKNGPNEARTRWALPVMFKSEVALAGDRPLDAVFVRRGDHWYAIANLDVVIRRRIDALDRGCAVLLELAAPPQRCREIQWQIADAALRVDSSRFAHACALGANLCAR